MNRQESNNVFTTNCPSTSGGKYVLKLPPAPQVIELTHEEPQNYTGMTINFFIKLFGFEEQGEIDIVSLGDNLKTTTGDDGKSLNVELIYNSPYGRVCTEEEK